MRHIIIVTNVLGILLCLTQCLSLAENEETGNVVQKDLEDLVRRLTQQQMRTTQNLAPSVLNYPDPEPDPTLPDVRTPFRSSGDLRGSRAFASSYASVKRPRGEGEARSEAGAYAAAVKDVDEEERMADNQVPAKGTTLSEMFRTSASQDDASGDDLSGRTGPYSLRHQQVETVVRKEDESFSDVYFVAIVAGCCAVGIFGVISAGFCFYKLQKSRKAAADVDYPAYGVTGPCKDVSSPNGDRKLAQSAQMYHYQHQKQQMIAVEKAGSTKNTSASDVDSEEENEEGDYTVYECPGLAPTGEMEVKNPLFHDDSTPMSPPIPSAKSDNIHN